jgi:hypothetical protein
LSPKETTKESPNENFSHQPPKIDIPIYGAQTRGALVKTGLWFEIAIGNVTQCLLTKPLLSIKSKKAPIFVNLLKTNTVSLRHYVILLKLYIVILKLFIVILKLFIAILKLLVIILKLLVTFLKRFEKCLTSGSYYLSIGIWKETAEINKKAGKAFRLLKVRKKRPKVGKKPILRSFTPCRLKLTFY